MINPNKTFEIRNNSFLGKAIVLNEKYTDYRLENKINDLRKCFTVIRKPDNILSPQADLIVNNSCNLPDYIASEMLEIFNLFFEDYFGDEEL